MAYVMTQVTTRYRTCPDTDSRIPVLIVCDIASSVQCGEEETGRDRYYCNANAARTSRPVSVELSSILTRRSPSLTPMLHSLKYAYFCDFEVHELPIFVYPGRLPCLAVKTE